MSHSSNLHLQLSEAGLLEHPELINEPPPLPLKGEQLESYKKELKTHVEESKSPSTIVYRGIVTKVVDITPSNEKSGKLSYRIEMDSQAYYFNCKSDIAYKFFKVGKEAAFTIELKTTKAGKVYQIIKNIIQLFEPLNIKPVVEKEKKITITKVQKKFEYVTKELSQKMDWSLAQMGNDGWILVDVDRNTTHLYSSCVKYLFMREII